MSQKGGEAHFGSQLNGGFGADSGPSRGDRCRRAIRPIEASKAAVGYARNTSNSGRPRRKDGPKVLWPVSPARPRSKAVYAAA